MDAAALLAVDDFFADFAERHHLPGLAYGVVDNGVLVHGRGRGRIDVERDGAPDENTAFRIASMTKSFTAAAVLALRDDGALGLDDPIAEHVPELRSLALPTSDARAVTIRQLASMASGLATDDPWADRLLDADVATMNGLFTSGATFADAPESALIYSNYGYAMLGRAITNAAGMPFQQFISERLLEPLGMPRTGWTAPAHRNATAYRKDADSWRRDMAPLGDGGFAAMGGLWSTVTDLSRWVAWFADAFPARDGTDDGPLRRSTRREMQQAWRADEPITGEYQGTTRVTSRGYGYGLFVLHDSRLGNVVAHSGGLPGFGSNMRWLPDRRVGVIALANVTYAPMSAATMGALDVLHDAAALPVVAPIVAPRLEEAARQLVTVLNDWDDRAADELFAFNVFLDDDRDTRRARALTDGRLTLERIRIVNRTDAEVVVRDQRGATRVLELSLSAEVPPRVQWYELKPLA